MARKPTDLLQYKIRVPYEMSRQIKKLADKSGRPISNEIVHLLEVQLYAERLGVGGMDGIAKAVQYSSAADAVQEMVKQLGLDKETETQSPPSITKRSDQ
jgi:hypothetical protein